MRDNFFAIFTACLKFSSVRTNVVVCRPRLPVRGLTMTGLLIELKILTADDILAALPPNGTGKPAACNFLFNASLSSISSVEASSKSSGRGSPLKIIRDLGFKISDLEFVSDFGFRISEFSAI